MTLETAIQIVGCAVFGFAMSSIFRELNRRSRK